MWQNEPHTFLTVEKPAVFKSPVPIIMDLSHLLYLIFQHTLDLVAHGLRAGLAEMNPHDIGGSAYLFHQCGRVLCPGCGHGVCCFRDILLAAHGIILLSRTVPRYA